MARGAGVPIGGLQTQRPLLELLSAVPDVCLQVVLPLALLNRVAGLTAVLLEVKHAQFLAREMGADLVQVGHDNELVRNRGHGHVRGVHQSGDAEFVESIERLKKGGSHEGLSSEGGRD